LLSLSEPGSAASHLTHLPYYLKHANRGNATVPADHDHHKYRNKALPEEE